LVATFTTSGVSVKANGVVQVSGATAVDFSASPVEYLVEAADHSTKAYAVSVNRVDTPQIPLTAAITGITKTTATGGGTITASSGAPVTARGICWGTAPDPTIANDHILDPGVGSGSFSCQMTGLMPGTFYYVRSFATNIAGTAYGLSNSFSTLPDLPVLAGALISGVTSTGATCGGSVTSDGGLSVTARGICWNATGNPLSTENPTAMGAGLGDFSGAFSGMAPNTRYYLRAYATNALGTSYGPQVLLTTLTNAPVTLVITEINARNAKSGGTISAGGSEPFTCGVCWSVNPNPTVSDSKTTDLPGTGSFTCSLTGLIPATNYYVRAYATNAGGTAYGDELAMRSVGYLGPAGGYVFYDAGVQQDRGVYGGYWRYMEAAPEDIGEFAWGDAPKTTLYGMNLGVGFDNSYELLADGLVHPATAQSDNYYRDVYDDWYLPSQKEMERMIVNLAAESIGVPWKSEYYWSSTQDNANSDQAIAKTRFGDACLGRPREDSYGVRPARRY
jgi:hypothetical protein